MVPVMALSIWSGFSSGVHAYIGTTCKFKSTLVKKIYSFVQFHHYSMTFELCVYSTDQAIKGSKLIFAKQDSRPMS